MIYARVMISVVIMSTAVNIAITSSDSSTSNRTLQLAVLLPYTGSWPVGYGISGAVPLAVNYIRTDTSFAYLRNKGYDFNYTIVDCPCDEGPGLTTFTRLLLTSQPPIDVYIGPACDNVCEPAGYMSLTADAQLITYACVSPILSHMSNVQRTVAPFNRIGPLVGAFIHKYHWSRVAILEGGDDVWQHAADYLRNYLTSGGVKVNSYHFYEIGWTDIPGENFTNTRFSTIAEAAIDNRVFIVLLSADELQSFIYIVDQLNLLDGQYAFLTVNLALDDTYWDTAYESCGINKTDVTGWFNLSPYYPTDNWTESFLTDVTNHSTVPEDLKTTLSFGPVAPALVDSHVFPLYNAIMLYATAVNNSVAAGYTTPDGTSLSSYFLTNTYYKGVNGLTYQTRHGDALPYFAISNVRNGVFVKVAQYVETGTQFINTRVQWPGGGFVPVLGRPECGWNNEYCIQDPIVNIVVPALVATICVTAAASIALAVIRRRNNMKRLKSSAWRLCYSDLRFFDINRSRRQSFTPSMDKSLMSTDSLVEEITSSAIPSGSLRLACFNNQLVAVKHLKKPTINFTKTLVAEINQVRLLRHTNVVSLVGMCVESGHVYFVTNYCSKGSLHDILQSSHVTLLDKIFTAAFINDIVQGMVYLHASPIQQHGNLKSSNVLIDSRWTCKLADFGLVELRAEEQRTLDDFIDYYGLLWTSPELLRQFGDNSVRRRGTRAGDVFAFGIIMQEIVTRKPPYDLKCTSPKEVIDRLLCVENPPFRPRVTVEAAGSLEMLDLMMSCWDEDPKNRPSFDTIVMRC